MKLGIIGDGAIGRYVRSGLTKRGIHIQALLVRSERLSQQSAHYPELQCVDSVADLPTSIDHVIDCAGHSALYNYGTDLLTRGVNLVTVSLGALADDALLGRLQAAAVEGNAKLYLASGAIGALDSLRAARVGGLSSVTYVGRKPPRGWKGSPAEDQLDLDALNGDAATHFSGSARVAAVEYPKNANVAAAVALAGIGFDETRVELIADPGISENVHEIRAEGEFGRFHFEIRGRSLPENPRSSALAAMSVISALEQQSTQVPFL